MCIRAQLSLIRNVCRAYKIAARRLGRAAMAARIEAMTPSDASTSDWLATPMGRRCLALEQRLMRRKLDQVFGEQMLQIGLWGEPDTFLRYARTQRSALLEWRPATAGADLVSDTGQLAVATDSIDAVLLPHTLELAPSPHALLREVNRVLRADGHVVILSFDPASLWGLRWMLSRHRFPPSARLIRERRTRDWLQLLSFDVAPALGYCHALPFQRLRGAGKPMPERFARRWLPFLAGAYLLFAKKQVRPLMPLRPSWRRKRVRAVAGLVEPTARASRSRAERTRESG